ncbi:hypothetical protein GH714_037460 [Hevea brasiliensis]|uniref:Uncharacterized protein n=1 Tax=Hevea brasiliensis TaxID=3981 RepID=A0A6A6MSU6_HEVBR|nr:hypothetical protein GH714_037460 [Hevea brasiliensis]
MLPSTCSSVFTSLSSTSRSRHSCKKKGGYGRGFIPINGETVALPVETQIPAKESVSAPRDNELQSSDPQVTVALESTPADETSPDMEGEGLISTQPLGETTLNVEMSKTVDKVLNRARKRPSKSAPTKPAKRNCLRSLPGASYFPSAPRLRVPVWIETVLDIVAVWRFAGRFAWTLSHGAFKCCKYPHKEMRGTLFTVGRNRSCDLVLNDPSISGILCKLKQLENGGISVALLEVTGVKEQFKLMIEARSGDPSAFAGASILASLSDFQKDLSLLSPPAKAGEDLQQKAEISTVPSVCGAPNNCIPEVVMKNSASNNELAGFSSREKTIVPSSNLASQNPNLDGLGLDATVDAGNRKIAGSAYELRPLFQILAGSSEFDLSGSISKILDEQREIREPFNVLDSPTVLMSTRRQAYKDSLQQGILNPEGIDVSFDSFPYYLSQYLTFLPLLSIRSEIYQETLVKALAKDVGARLLVIDSFLLPGKPTSSVEADITGGSTISSQGLPKPEPSTASSKSYTFKTGDRVKFVGLPSLHNPPRGPAVGFRGKVVLAFEENGSSKIGVRFDRSIPEGNDLGANSLRLDGPGGEDVDRLAVNELFEVALDESKRGPLILFVKDIEKSMVGNQDAYTALRSKLENLPKE